MLELFFQPFVLLALGTAFILAGIHTYLGFHVVSRGVIFVDLCLAQAAAFGAVIALTIGFPEHGIERYFVSLLFTLFGALLISFARTKDDRVPQEAFIGIIYAGFTIGTILLLAKRAEGGEELNHVLSGSLLTVQPKELIKILVLYAGIGVFHWIFRERFFAISRNRIAAAASGLSVRLWDFLFYASFGIVVTSSVEVAGVMLVFALLVIPPVIAVLYTMHAGTRLALGWILGFGAAFFGMLFSIRFDFPVGPSIGAVLVVALICGVLINMVKGFSKRSSRV